MAKRSKKSDKSQAKLQGYVVVAFAEDWEQARQYESLLKANDIPTAIEEHHDASIGADEIAVMVPDEHLDEAHVIIESQDSYEDLYEMPEGGQQDHDFDGEFYEEEY